MASLNIDYPDAQQKRIVDAMCFIGHWSAELGVTRNAFAKAQAAEILQRRVFEAEEQMARQAAMAAVPQRSPLDMT